MKKTCRLGDQKVIDGKHYGWQAMCPNQIHSTERIFVMSMRFPEGKYDSPIDDSNEKFHYCGDPVAGPVELDYWDRRY